MTKALFLDRDGVINLDHGYVHTAEKFDLVPGIIELCAIAKSLGYVLVIVTNQAGIARGYYTEEQYQQFTSHIRDVFATHDITFAGIYHCPYHPEHGDKIDHPDRKPNPGMLHRAATELGLTLAQSVMVGDNVTDMQAAQRARIPTRIYFNDSNKTPPEATHHTRSHRETIALLQNL